MVRPFIWSVIRNGAQTNAWSDNWCHLSPLRDFITPRHIANAGFNLQSSVADILDANGQWRWPQAWYDTYPVLIGLTIIRDNSQLHDRLVWKDLEGNERQFSSMEVWHAIRLRSNTVSWANMVWFSQCIPRHSFQLWLVIKNKLKTQDRLKVWEAGSETNLRLMCCPLCQRDRDSRDHLFFACNFSSQVWMNVKSLVDMKQVNALWSSVLAWMEQYSSSTNLEHIVSKLVLAASAYFIWQERNNRLFSRMQCSATQVSEKIKSSVRFRLMGFKFKGHSDLNHVLRKWKIPSRASDEDPG
ncbi:uncharacterized protein LOC110863935 [Helianthus annuus]|uniref:uncharacterized protein LOC110863935 n=1 Tax=Helianthus annuus TaxID=4232 RepID=UPI000B8FE86E|nr:uncharacterized protein LOC110863935 [Helianthus annuus]